jgi:hypothetical protein
MFQEDEPIIRKEGLFFFVNRRKYWSNTETIPTRRVQHLLSMHAWFVVILHNILMKKNGNKECNLKPVCVPDKCTMYKCTFAVGY